MKGQGYTVKNLRKRRKTSTAFFPCTKGNQKEDYISQLPYEVCLLIVEKCKVPDAISLSMCSHLWNACVKGATSYWIRNACNFELDTTSVKLAMRHCIHMTLTRFDGTNPNHLNQLKNIMLNHGNRESESCRGEFTHNHVKVMVGRLLKQLCYRVEFFPATEKMIKPFCSMKSNTILGLAQMQEGTFCLVLGDAYFAYSKHNWMDLKNLTFDDFVYWFQDYMYQRV
jgi:hypothetical protein